MGALIKSLAVLTALVAVIGADHGPHGHHGHDDHDHGHHHGGHEVHHVDHEVHHEHGHDHDDPDHGLQRKRETHKDEKKYCPLEYKRNRCRARRNQFKCGVFFMDLHGQSERLRWIAALPDALVKPSLRNSPVLMRSINNVSKRDFTVPKGDCDARAANNECLDIMSDLTHQNLESCERNLLNEHGHRTLGNVLCEKAGLWAPGQHFQSFVTVGFFHSACGGNWTATSIDGQHLKLKEEICCKFDNGHGRWFRCDGSQYKGTCDDDPNDVVRIQ